MQKILLHLVAIAVHTVVVGIILPPGIDRLAVDVNEVGVFSVVVTDGVTFGAETVNVVSKFAVFHSYPFVQLDTPSVAGETIKISSACCDSSKPAAVSGGLLVAIGEELGEGLCTGGACYRGENVFFCSGNGNVTANDLNVFGIAGGALHNKLAIVGVCGVVSAGDASFLFGGVGGATGLFSCKRGGHCGKWHEEGGCKTKR